MCILWKTCGSAQWDYEYQQHIGSISTYAVGMWLSASVADLLCSFPAQSPKTAGAEQTLQLRYQAESEQQKGRTVTESLSNSRPDTYIADRYCCVASMNCEKVVIS